MNESKPWTEAIVKAAAPYRDQYVGAEAGRPVAEFPLQPYGPAEDRGEEDPEDEAFGCHRPGFLRSR